MTNSYNFLPPFNQLYTTGPVPGNIGDISRLDPYLPVFELTNGNIQSLIINDGTFTGFNIDGITGPVGPGLSGNPPPATPFMMVTYAQTSQGLVQFILMKGSTTNIPGMDNVGDDDDTYFFMPVNNTIDYGRVVQVYYSVDNSIPVDSSNGPPSQFTPEGVNANFQGMRFFDAEQIIANPSTNVYEFELSVYTTMPGDPNAYAIWPYKKSFRGDTDYIYKPVFYFNEFLEGTNKNENQLKSGKFYHPYFIAGTDAGQYSQGFIIYSSIPGYTGYGPGYPISINYGYAEILPTTQPTIEYGNDNPNAVDTPSGFKTWPVPVPLSLYNFPVSSIKNVISTTSNGSQSNIINNLINQICTNNPFLQCTCGSNNSCTNIQGNSYTQININTVQAGIANFLTYQFIPFTQIKTPPNFIITDPNNPNNTSYSYVTLPYNELNQQIEVTPQGFSGNIPYGSYAVQTDVIIDPGTGSTGVTVSNTSILSGWINTPQNISYQCDREVTNTSYCGFLDYYDSLFGISYEYGTCGGTGPNDPFQKGTCPNNEVCIPNFDFLKNYDSQSEIPFICVSGSTGVSYDNLTNYYNSFPKITNNTPYNVGSQYGQFQNTNYTPEDVKKEGLNIWVIAAIVIGVLLIVVILVSLVRSFVKKGPDYKTYSKIEFS